MEDVLVGDVGEQEADVVERLLPRVLVHLGLFEALAIGQWVDGGDGGGGVVCLVACCRLVWERDTLFF